MPRKRLVEQAAALAGNWPALQPVRRREILSRLISRIEVTDRQVKLHLLRSGLARIMDGPADVPTAPSTAPEETIVLTLDLRLERIGRDTRLILNTAGGSNPQPTPGLVRLLAQAHQVQRRLLRGAHATITVFAQQEQMTGSYIARLIRLAWLAPDIVQAILHGRQPPALSVITLMQSGPLPMDWQAQRQRLGFT